METYKHEAKVEVVLVDGWMTYGPNVDDIRTIKNVPLKLNKGKWIWQL
jgi:hypothetical protein